MSKLQPNFSWQKYEDKPEDQAEQFQYQLQSQHVLAANAINATIDDSSFFLTERQTSFTWVNGQPIWTWTLPTVAWTAGGTVNTIPFNPMALTKGYLLVIWMRGYLSNGTLFTSDTLILPHIDVTAGANEVSIVRNGTSIILTSGTDRSAYSGFVTVYYLKN